MLEWVVGGRRTSGSWMLHRSWAGAGRWVGGRFTGGQDAGSSGWLVETRRCGPPDSAAQGLTDILRTQAGAAKVGRGSGSWMRVE